MATLEELIPQFHEFVANRAEEIYVNVHQQKVCPLEIRPNLKEHYSNLANSAFKRVSRRGIIATSKIQDPKQKAIEDAIASFDNSVLNSKKEYQESYDSWEKAIAHLLDKKEFADLLWSVREAYKGLMTPGTINRTPYDKVVEALTDAYNVALRMIYTSQDKTKQTVKEETTQLKLSDRYDISYFFFIKRGDNYVLTGKKGGLNQALNGPVEERTLGRDTPQNSVFINLKSVFDKENDTTVSEKHLYLEEAKEGLALNDISETNTSYIDYDKNMLLLQRKDSKNRDPLQAILVPAGIDKKSIDVGALFGGYDGEKYQLKIHLERKRQLP